MADRGVKVDQYIWEEKKPLLTQTRTISKYAEPTQKKLAFAFMNQTLDPKVFGRFAELFYLRPACKNIEVTPKMAAKGITSTADSIKGFWIPDYQRYLDHADEVEETGQRDLCGLVSDRLAFRRKEGSELAAVELSCRARSAVRPARECGVG